MKKSQAALAEFAGSALLLMVVVGSGIMGEQLSAGNAAVALLGNSIATGAGLYVLIVLLGPVSGAHFNPLVTAMMWRRGDCSATAALLYLPCQVLGAIVGVWLCHAMFALPLIQFSTHARSSPNLWLSEFIATLVLLVTIHMGTRSAPDRVPMLVALIVTSGYWFTSSTFFANPAVTIARSMSDTFAGIAPEGVTAFIAAQLLAALCVVCLVAKGNGTRAHT
jgi:glycerol uptake facilitator-like aquaporin